MTGIVISHDLPIDKADQYAVLKVNRCLEIATENDLPLISLVQSAGVFLPQQRTVFHNGGKLFYDLAKRSAAGKPSCAIVFGSSTAGGAYHPALSDYTIFVENQGQAFLGGPPLVKMATGEVIEAEELGGAKVHATMTGLADQIATDEYVYLRGQILVFWFSPGTDVGYPGLMLSRSLGNGLPRCRCALNQHPG
jgi:acetyl-CoA carboxylase carboxyltransferase component